VFDPVQINQDHLSGPGPDRILVAELPGTARRHARWRELAQDEQGAAVTELRELAGGRADLLAEVAGIFEGASEGELDEPLAKQAAQLCRLAGADETLIPQWVKEGRRRAGITCLEGQPEMLSEFFEVGRGQRHVSVSGRPENRNDSPQSWSWP
jgi:hypothetical protein